MIKPKFVIDTIAGIVLHRWTPMFEASYVIRNRSICILTSVKLAVRNPNLKLFNKAKVDACAFVQKEIIKNNRNSI